MKGWTSAHPHLTVPLPLAQATKKTAELAQRIRGLKGFVHVSTSYVNSNLGRGSHIEEAIHPLFYRNGKRVEHAKLALQLAAMPPAKAERTVCSARLPGAAVPTPRLPS